MTSRRARSPRVLRSGLLAVAGTAIAVAAHVTGGGGVPDLGLTLLLTSALAWIGTAVADSRPTVPRTVAVLAVTQVLLHCALTVMPMLAAAAEHHHDVPAPGVAPMLTAHVVAVVVTGALLTRADDAARSAATVIAHLVPRWWSSPPEPAPTVCTWPVRPTPVTGHRATVLLCRTGRRRGPPLGR